MHSPLLPPLDWGSFWSTWSFHLGWMIACAVLLVGYLAGFTSARRRGVRSVSIWRAVCFVFGVVLLGVTISSAIDAYAMDVFWMHMVEHLTLIMLVPAFLVLGHPLTVLRDAFGAPTSEKIGRVLRSPAVALPTHPAIGVGLYAVVIFGTHLTGFMDQMAMHSWLMTAEQVLYVFSGWLLLLPLIGEEPIRWHPPYLLRIMLLLVAMVPDTVVGIVLLQTDRVPFPMMMAMHPSWAPRPLDDVHIGGALMWAAGDGLMMSLAVGLVVTLVTGKTQDRILGDWLESVRRSTLDEAVSRSGGESAIADSGDVDEDDSALASYNAMLGRLDKHTGA